MDLTPRHRQYWSKNLRLTALLLAGWAVVTFVPVYWAQALNRIVLFGWPLAYYMGAQGSLIVYVLLIWIYARRMDRLDRDYGVQEAER
jgi:putative solute:sodium symporter small subunit